MRDTKLVWISAGAGALALMLAGVLPAAADSGRAWDDRHMQSRFGGSQAAPLEAPALEGDNGFRSPAPTASGRIGVQEQWLAGSQHPWHGNAVGLTASPGGRSARRPDSRALERHSSTPGSWTRSGQQSSLRGSAVRRSSSGR